MTKEEAIRILDEVIPPPEHHMVDLDHLPIAQAWLCIKETLTAEPVKRGGRMTFTVDGKNATAWQAYQLANHELDKEYIRGSLMEQYWEGDDVPRGLASALSNDDLLDQIAWQYREFLDDIYGSDTEWRCLKDAFHYICG